MSITSAPAVALPTSNTGKGEKHEQGNSGWALVRGTVSASRPKYLGLSSSCTACSAADSNPAQPTETFRQKHFPTQQQGYVQHQYSSSSSSLAEGGEGARDNERQHASGQAGRQAQSFTNKDIVHQQGPPCPQ
jgi:hypothetical protein